MAEQRALPFIGRDLITVTEAARILNLSAQMVRVLANQGELDCLRLGPDGHRYFDRPCIEKYALDRQVLQLMGGQRGRGMRVPYAARRSAR